MQLGLSRAIKQRRANNINSSSNNNIAAAGSVASGINTAGGGGRQHQQQQQQQQRQQHDSEETRQALVLFFIVASFLVCNIPRVVLVRIKSKYQNRENQVPYMYKKNLPSFFFAKSFLFSSTLPERVRNFDRGANAQRPLLLPAGLGQRDGRHLLRPHRHQLLRQLLPLLPGQPHL